MPQGTWITCLALALLLAGPLAGAQSDPAPGIPPDGPSGPVRSLAQLRSTEPVGSMVTTQAVLVRSVSCPDCPSATSAADFVVGDGNATLRVHVEHTWQARYNVKKQNNVPAVGQLVVVQGRLQESGGERFIQMKRFGLAAHEGPTAKAYDVAAGRYPTGTYLWLDPVRVLNVGLWDDGDRTFDVRDPQGGGLVHIELASPYYGQIPVPSKGDLIQPFGMVRFDPDHNWWEMHPVRCLRPKQCVPAAAGYLLNGVPEKTPGRGGSYLQGGPEPVWVPLEAPPGTGGMNATFTVRSPGAWWQQVTVQPSPRSALASVAMRVDSGSWRPMKAESWGDWTLSTYVPKGARVEFKAMAGTGMAATSLPFSWLDGTAIRASAPPSEPPPPNATAAPSATFTPVSGNDWWVQVRVESSTALKGVDVAVNGGVWVPLDHSSWGDWVRSLRAKGSVQFRAVAATGETIPGPSMAWPP